MEIYEITVKDKSSRRTINRALVDDLEVRGEFLRLYLKGIYVTSSLVLLALQKQSCKDDPRR